MTIGELKEFLSEVPEGLTLEEFDDLDFMFSEDGFLFSTPCLCQSGLVEIEEEDGTECILFAVMPHDVDECDIDFELPDINLN